MYADKDIFGDGQWMGAHFRLTNLGWVDEIYSSMGGYEFSKIADNKWHSLVMYFEAKYPLETLAPIYQNLREVKVTLSKEETERLANSCVEESETKVEIQFGPRGNFPRDEGKFEMQKLVAKTGEEAEKFGAGYKSVNINETIQATYLYYAVQGKSGKTAVINLETGKVEYCGNIQPQQSFMTQIESSQARGNSNPIQNLLSGEGIMYVVIGAVILIILFMLILKIKKVKEQ